MQGHPEVIQHLNDLLAGELMARDQYFLHARMYENWGFSKLYERIWHETQEETELQRLFRHDGENQVRRLRMQFPQGFTAVSHLGKR